jgi:hypothetical protein
MKTRKAKAIVKHLELVNMDEYPDFLIKGLVPLEMFQSNWTANRRDSWKKKASKYLKVMIACDTNREHCKDLLGINDQMYDAIEAILMEGDARKYCSMSPPQRFYVYSIQMEAAIGQLNDYIKVNQHNDRANIVGAVKTVAQLRKDVLKTGQEMNVIDVKAKAKTVVGNVNVAVLTTDEIKKMLQDRMENFNNIVDVSTDLAGPYKNILQRSVKQLPDDVDDVEEEVDEDDDDNFLED